MTFPSPENPQRATRGAKTLACSSPSSWPPIRPPLPPSRRWPVADPQQGSPSAPLPPSHSLFHPLPLFNFGGSRRWPAGSGPLGPDLASRDVLRLTSTSTVGSSILVAGGSAGTARRCYSGRPPPTPSRWWLARFGPLGPDLASRRRLALTTADGGSIRAAKGGAGDRGCRIWLAGGAGGDGLWVRCGQLCAGVATGGCLRPVLLARTDWLWPDGEPTTGC